MTPTVVLECQRCQYKSFNYFSEGSSIFQNLLFHFPPGLLKSTVCYGKTIVKTGLMSQPNSGTASK